MKEMVMSSFCEKTYCALTMKSTESLKKPLETMVAQETAMPTMDKKVRIGFLSILRAIIRAGCVSQGPMPVFSISVTLYLAGASGRIASAGGCLAAFQSECMVPASADRTLTETAAMRTSGCSV